MKLATLQSHGVDVDVVEAGDTGSDLALDSVRTLVPTGTASVAFIDADQGMILIGTFGGIQMSLWFRSLVCGFSGGGPIDSVKALVALGFGDKAELEQQVFSQSSCRFAK